MIPDSGGGTHPVHNRPTRPHPRASARARRERQARDIRHDLASLRTAGRPGVFGPSPGASRPSTFRFRDDVRLDTSQIIDKRVTHLSPFLGVATRARGDPGIYGVARRAARDADIVRALARWGGGDRPGGPTLGGRSLIEALAAREDMPGAALHTPEARGAMGRYALNEPDPGLDLLSYLKPGAEVAEGILNATTGIPDLVRNPDDWVNWAMLLPGEKLPFMAGKGIKAIMHRPLRPDPLRPPGRYNWYGELREARNDPPYMDYNVELAENFSEGFDPSNIVGSMALREGGHVWDEALQTYIHNPNVTNFHSAWVRPDLRESSIFMRLAMEALDTALTTGRPITADITNDDLMAMVQRFGQRRPEAFHSSLLDPFFTVDPTTRRMRSMARRARRQAP